MAEGAPFKWTQWIAPLLIGTAAAGAVVWFGAHHEVNDPQTGQATTSWSLLQQFEWSRRSTWALLGVIACVLLRDIGYIVRLRILSFQSFSWRQGKRDRGWPSHADGRALAKGHQGRQYDHHAVSILGPPAHRL